MPRLRVLVPGRGCSGLSFHQEASSRASGFSFLSPVPPTACLRPLKPWGAAELCPPAFPLTSLWHGFGSICPLESPWMPCHSPPSLHHPSLCLLCGSPLTPVPHSGRHLTVRGVPPPRLLPRPFFAVHCQCHSRHRILAAVSWTVSHGSLLVQVHPAAVLFQTSLPWRRPELQSWDTCHVHTLTVEPKRPTFSVPGRWRCCGLDLEMSPGKLVFWTHSPQYKKALKRGFCAGGDRNLTSGFIH